MSSNSSSERARYVRQVFGVPLVGRIPVSEIATWYGVNARNQDDPDSRWLNAYDLGRKLGTFTAEAFADELLCPLYLLEPIVCYGGKKTGERWFFGLLEKKRPYTTEELVEMFGCPTSAIIRQMKRVL